MSAQTHFRDIPKRKSLSASDVLEHTAESKGRGILKETDHLLFTSNRRRTGYLILTASMLVTFGLIWLVMVVVVPGIQDLINQWKYGDAKVSYQQLTLNGKSCDVLGIGYRGDVEVILLPDLQDQHSTSHVYALPKYLSDGKSHVVTLTAQDVNLDGLTDIVVRVDDGSTVLMPVLYATKTGYQWTAP